MEGISDVIAVTMILMITVALASLGYVFFVGTFSSVSNITEQSVNQTTAGLLASFKIESVSGNNIFIRNTGSVPLSSIAVYGDDVPANITTMTVDGFQSASIPPGKIAKVTVNGSSLPTKKFVTLKVTSSQAFEQTSSWRRPMIAVFKNDTCNCQWTVAGCSSWWQDRLREKGFAVKPVSTIDIDSLEEMQQYDIIFNPYGEMFPEINSVTLPILNNIKNYVTAGGWWFEAGGYSFYYACGSTTSGPYSGGSAVVCVRIDGTDAAGRTLNYTYSYMTPNGPNSVGTGILGGPTSRPSIGNQGTCINQDFKGLYINSTVNRFGPALHCYGSGCIVRNDFVSTDVVTIYSDIINTVIIPTLK